MKPLSERDENLRTNPETVKMAASVGMKPLSERDENIGKNLSETACSFWSRNEATL